MNIVVVAGFHWPLGPKVVEQRAFPRHDVGQLDDVLRRYGVE